MRHAKVVFLLSLLLMTGLSVGIQYNQIDQELSDGLPNNNPNKLALDRVMDKLPGVSTLEAVLMELDPEKAEAQGVQDIREQDAIRAIEYVYDFVKERVPDLSGGVSLNHIVKMVRVVVNDNDDSYFELPPETPEGRAEFEALWAVANNTVRSNIELTIRNPDYQSTTMAIQYDTPLNSDASKEVGLALTNAFAEYRQKVADGQVPARYDLFKEQYVYNIGPQSGLIKFENHLRDEFPVFVPIAVAFIFVAVMIGLRSPRNAILGMSMLAVATVSTIGLIGWLRIPFTSANLTMIPLIIGNGIDYGIHVLNEYSEERGHGRSIEESFREVGRRAGVAMVLATSTSVLGLLSLLFASSNALRQLSISASAALIMVTVLSLTYIPASVALFGGKRTSTFKPSEFMATFYKLVNRNKVFSLGVFITVSVLLTANVSNLQYFTDVTASNFNEDDPFVQTYLHLRERQQGSADELIIIEGDLTSPETLAWIRQVEEDLINETSIVASRAHVNSLTVLLGAYEVLTANPEAIPRFVGPSLDDVLAGEDPVTAYESNDQVRDAAPTTREAIASDIEAMQASVAWSPLINFLYSQDGSLTIIDVLVDGGDPAERDFAQLENIQETLQRVVDANRDSQPDGIEVHYNGLQTGLYQYLEYSFHWLRILFFVSAITGSLLMFLFTRSFRATLAFVTPMIFTTTWVLGILPFFDILVGASLILPLIFVTSIGSDYAAHLIWDTLREGRPLHTYKSAGKGILFSAITDFGAFFVFTFSEVRSAIASVSMATALSIVAIFLVTMLTVPLFFNRERDDEASIEPASHT